jgi:hypothetical protein
LLRKHRSSHYSQDRHFPPAPRPCGFRLCQNIRTGKKVEQEYPAEFKSNHPSAGFQTLQPVLLNDTRWMAVIFQPYLAISSADNHPNHSPTASRISIDLCSYLQEGSVECACTVARQRSAKPHPLAASRLASQNQPSDADAT